MRKSLVAIIVFALAVLPLFGAFAKPASAASSRVAVIKELKGSVKVKKAGGSKEFTAFAKMSLNEGDVLSVGSGASAVLQFANGTSEDDSMTVAANSTLTFSKLSNKKGTTTKVSLFNGSAWVDVKSIENKDDEFTLETPTAIMGVRGTHLLVSVDPVSGATRLTVAAGVVTTQTTDENNPQTEEVIPTKKALITKDGNDSEITIAQVDLDLLMKQSERSIIEAIVKAAGEITQENIAKMNSYPADGSEYFKKNLTGIVGAIIASALESKAIDQNRINELLAEVKANSGVEIDLSNKKLEISNEEKAKQENQKKKEKEASDKAADKKKKEKESRDREEELQKKLKEKREQQQKDKAKSLEDARKKALEEYEKQLSELEKKKFEDDKNKREKERQDQTASPSATNTGSSGGGGGGGGTVTNPPTQTPSGTPSETPTEQPSEPPFDGLKYYYFDANAGLKWNHALVFDPDQMDYQIEVPVNGVYAIVTERLAENIEVKNVKIYDGYEGYWDAYSDETGYLVPLQMNRTEIKIEARIDGTITKYYYVTIAKDSTPEGIASWTQSYGIGSEWNSFEWLVSIGNTFGYLVPSNSSQLKVNWTFEPGIAKAVVKHTKYNVDIRNGDLIPTVETATETILNGKNKILDIASDVDLFEVQLQDAAGSPKGDGYMIWVIDEDLDYEYPEKPFLINDGSVSYEEDYDPNRFYARVDGTVSSLRITKAEGSIIAPSEAYNYSTDEFIYALNGVLDLPLQEGNNEFEIVLKNASGLEQSYNLTVDKYDLPQGIEDWSVMDSSEHSHRWELAVNQPPGTLKRYFVEVGDVSRVDLDFTVAAGYSLSLTDASGTYPITGSSHSVNLSGNGGYSLKLMNGSVALAELLIIKGGLEPLDESTLRFSQGESTMLETTNTLTDESLENYSQGFSVVSATYSTDPITMKILAYVGDVSVIPLESGVTISGPYMTMSFPAPGVYHVNIKAYDPTDHDEYLIYPVTIYYRVSPVPVTITNSDFIYSGGVNVIAPTPNKFDYSVSVSGYSTSIGFKPQLPPGARIVGFIPNGNLSASYDEPSQSYTIYGLFAGTTRSISFTVEDASGNRISYTLTFNLSYV
ncbi:FecR domain-containing protein [Cohnella cholangitidis]|uniref:FecR protein domain-containing protein n=1 Tax=Cohnella cholangitidis TaxID=2598458 RepID=A0A7G5C3V4_9BACL|nr:FecR domain-containing protein [Cohnella cholangitidis]QMV43888.1 hypothetical protein FPL14_23975 [Cohnella cholangitidis]